jgi:pimeloyl-ACP methyl ester carboxylesterase
MAYSDRIMGTLYSTRVTATGGRPGHIRSEDRLLDMKLALPRELGGKGDATNPETLFAGRYAAFLLWVFFGQQQDVLAQGKLKMPVFALGGEATFGPMIGAVTRCVAANIEDVIIPDCGHWITEEQPQATTKLVVDFLGVSPTKVHVKSHRNLFRSPCSGPHPGTPYRPIRVTCW